MLGFLPLVQDSDLSWTAGPAVPQHLPPWTEHCPSRRRRKRSSHLAISQAYSGFYSNDLIEQSAMENFFSFDLNLDGLISLEEVMQTYKGNGTEEGFKQADLNSDGFVEPSELDFSLS